jgi:hypothetical protein
LVKIGKRRATSDEHSDNKDDKRKDSGKQKPSLNRTDKTEFESSKDVKFASGSLGTYIKPSLV